MEKYEKKTSTIRHALEKKNQPSNMNRIYTDMPYSNSEDPDQNVDVTDVCSMFTTFYFNYIEIQYRKKKCVNM